MEDPMPNNVLNEVIFRNVGRNVQETILEKVLKDGFVDFNILVPTPLNIWQGNLGYGEEKAFGNKVWLKWNIENWGTKWNAYGQSDDCIVQTDDTLTITFQTAWDPPHIWLCALFNATQLPFEHNWISEGGENTYTAKFFVSNENECRFSCRKEEDAEEKIHRRLHVQLWGYEPESAGN
jgi:hypothetical protein